MIGTYGKWQLPFLGKHICSTALCRSLDIGKYSFKKAVELATPLPHGNIGQSHEKNNVIIAKDFLSQALAKLAEIQPNCDEYHLPMCILK